MIKIIYHKNCMDGLECESYLLDNEKDLIQ
jgi:hypothetical protein